MSALAQKQELAADAAEASRLTPRELDVLRLMCDGLMNKQIANTLGISKRTCEIHRGRLLDKSGCKTACELGAWAVRSGLVGECA